MSTQKHKQNLLTKQALILHLDKWYMQGIEPNPKLVVKNVKPKYLFWKKIRAWIVTEPYLNKFDRFEPERYSKRSLI